MFITVTGLFKELDGKKNPNRYFNRTFVIVPEGGGYCIRNEQLHIGQPTEAQEKASFAENISVQMNQQPEPTASSSSSAQPVATGSIDDSAKREMTVALSQQTSMNLEWSFKCLEEVSWNFNNALTAFQEFFKLGQIPAEAFAK